MNKIVEQVLNSLINEPVFKDFKIRKCDECLIQKTTDGFNKIEFDDHFQSVDLSNHKLALEIRPIFVRRFDVLSKWFEKYSFKELKIQRNNGQIFDNIPNEEFLFYNTGEYFDEQYNKLKSKVIEKAHEFFNEYATLEQLYQKEVYTILTEDKKIPTVGADWIFEYLKLTWIIDRENYNKVKDLILKQIEFMMFGRKHQEPNISKYYDRLDEIFADIEQS